VICDRCGCDRLNGYDLDEPCPDCELCCCGHNAFAHSSAWHDEECYECACPRYTPLSAFEEYEGPRLLPVLYHAEERWLIELRAAWASGRRVALTL
jgi:hypothetical protein